MIGPKWLQAVVTVYLSCLKWTKSTLPNCVWICARNEIRLPSNFSTDNVAHDIKLITMNSLISFCMTLNYIVSFCLPMSEETWNYRTAERNRAQLNPNAGFGEGQVAYSICHLQYCWMDGENLRKVYKRTRIHLSKIYEQTCYHTLSNRLHHNCLQSC